MSIEKAFTYFFKTKAPLFSGEVKNLSRIEIIVEFNYLKKKALSFKERIKK